MAQILITVDLEDWFQVENLRSCFPIHTWQNCELRLEEPTHKLLEMFDAYNIKATFFVLGWIAKRLPNLVKKISSHGHEIASHGYGHKLCYDINQSSLREDVLKSKRILEDITSRLVMGYRAPSFSTNQTLISILKNTGFVYDSSYNDFSAHGRYGSLHGSWKEVRPGLLLDHEGFHELPVSNLKFFGRTIPWGGGGYFRIIPSWLFNKGVKRILSKGGSYLFYCHPWEFDPGQPKVKGLNWNHRFRHYTGIGRSLKRLENFLRNFQDNQIEFLTCSQLVASGKQVV